MESYNELISQALDSYSPKRQYERILELLEAEKKLNLATENLKMVDDFRFALQESHPNIARLVPSNMLLELDNRNQ